MCAECAAAFPRIRPPLCERCGAPTGWPVRRCGECAGRRVAFAAARAAVAYDASVRRVVVAWKEKGLRRLARLAAAVVTEALPRPEVEAIAFVPADAERRRDRGHHPAEQLAVELARAWELPLERLLQRGGVSRRQRGLSLAERRANVRDAFVAAPAPSRVAVIDDVYTTGATAAAAASALRRAGARHVEIVTFARAVRGYNFGPQARPPPAKESPCVFR